MTLEVWPKQDCPSKVLEGILLVIPHILNVVPLAKFFILPQSILQYFMLNPDMSKYLDQFFIYILYINALWGHHLWIPSCTITDDQNIFVT